MFLGTAAPALRSPLTGEKTDEGAEGRNGSRPVQRLAPGSTGHVQWTRREWEHPQSLGSRGERLARETQNFVTSENILNVRVVEDTALLPQGRAPWLAPLRPYVQLPEWKRKSEHTT